MRLLILLLAACSVGEVAPLDAVVRDPMFDAVIAPLVVRCLPCHHGDPMNEQPTLTSFAALQPQYKVKPGATNALVTKGDHHGIAFFSAADAATVAAWIDGL